MPRNDGIERVAVVAAVTFRGLLQGRRGIGLVLVAAIYPALVLAIAAARRTNIDLLAASELLYTGLFLPVLLLIVCLVLAVSLFRGEIEDDTIVYPVTRSLPRWQLVLGKYLGFAVAAVLCLLPAALLGTAIGTAFNLDATTSLGGVAATLLLTTPIAILAYGALFLLLGLVTRQALVIGLIYGFLWETFVPLLPGPLEQLTLIYYLRDIGGNLAANGPLASVPRSVGLPLAAGVPLLVAAAVIGLSCLYIRVAELTAAASPA